MIDMVQKDFLFLTYSPVKDFSDEETIINLQLLKSKIEKLTWVESVITIIDVPLLKSSDESLMKRLQNYKTLSYPEVDKKRGFEEIINSPIYNNYVISDDGKTSGIVVYLKKDERLEDFIKTKNDYFDEGITDKNKYKIFIKEYENYKNLYNKRNHQNIKEIRDVISKYSEGAKIYLGGIPMIADDMMTFIKSDIVVFGLRCFYIYSLNLVDYFQKLKMGRSTINWLCSFCFMYDWFVRFFRMESYGNFIKFYCIDVNFKYGHEYSRNGAIFTN